MNTNDSGAGSLRQALLDSHSGDTIRFSAQLARQTITLTSDELTINHNLTITGLGEHNLTIDGNGQFRIFDITGATHVAISRLTLADGLAGSSATNPGEGGAIFDKGGSLTLRHVLMRNDKAVGSDGISVQNATNAAGGAIFFSGQGLAIYFSSFSGNQAQGGAAVTAGSVGITLGGAGGSAHAGTQGNLGSTGQGEGGAIYNASTTSIHLVHDTFESDTATTSNNDVFGPETGPV